MAFLTLIAGFLWPARAPASALSPAAQLGSADKLQQFAPVSPGQGWVLLGPRLFWTSDSGASWSDITPPLPASAVIYSVRFQDSQEGRLLWSSVDPNGVLDLEIAATSDGGLSWADIPVAALSPDDPASSIQSAGLQWLDDSDAFVFIQRQTGSNFSSGDLFHTSDAGKTWDRSPLPLGGQVTFVDPQVGWVSGGPAQDQLFKTSDGGASWQEQFVPVPSGAQSISLYPPIFSSRQDGLLAIITSNDDSFTADFFSTSTGGDSWELLASHPLGSQVSLLALSILDSHDLVAAVPNTSDILRLSAGAFSVLSNLDGLSASITDLRMLSLSDGWAAWNTSSCEKQPASGSAGETTSCTSTTQLLQTADGGFTWQALILPSIGTAALVQNATTSSPSIQGLQAASAGNTGILIGQGFDACNVPGLSQLQGWATSSPYKAVNIYIGGIARGCPNTLLTTAYVAQIAALGWSFIPTWVGPQAPCTNFTHRFSSTVSAAYTDGVNEAISAVNALASLGLTLTDKSGSVVYYDLEAYIGDQTCRDAVKSFMSGWVAGLHMFGDQAGVYGSTGCTNGLNNFLSIANVPDLIWPAIWDHTPGTVDADYEPLATVWTAGCIATSVWSNHQRIRQYEGAHNEKWGTVTINIDNDVIDGVVAVPFFGTPSAAFSASPVSGLSPMTVTFTIANTIYMTSCSWIYGDGQTGTSCAPTHTHTYNSGGTFTVSLTAVGPGGSNTVTHTNYITVSQTSKPDLRPSPEGGNTDPVSLSSVSGTVVNGPLYADRTTYIDWGFENDSLGAAGPTFNVDLYIDDTQIIDYPFAGMAAASSAGYHDWAVAWTSPGWHTVRMVIDPANTVDESNETNNTWTSQFYWETASATGPSLISPSGPVASNHPTYTWNPITNAATYDLVVNSLVTGTTVISVTSINPIQICSTTCSYVNSFPLSNGDYQFKAVVHYGNNTSADSAWMAFTVGGAPSAPSVTAPAGTITDTTPSYSWTRSAGASWYDILIYPSGSTNPVMSAVSLLANTWCSTSTCTWTPTMPLARGVYQFKVRAANLAGSSEYSSLGSFTLNADTSFYFDYLPLIIH